MRRKGVTRTFTGVVFSTFAVLILAACGGGAPDGGIVGAPPFNLSCDMGTTYSPVASPETTVGTGTPTTTVIALHGKNGSPTRTHMTDLATDLADLGYNVSLPYMPWREFDWDGSLCDSMSYINSLIAAEKTAGNAVILLGHSLAGPIVLSYVALTNTTKPDALAVVAPGHFVGTSSLLDSYHAASVNTAKSMVTAGHGDDTIATFQTYNGGFLYDISTTANIYLSYHDPAEFPDIKASIPLVTAPTLWLAGLSDSLTSSAKSLGIIATIPASSDYDYREIAGDHLTVVGNVPAELDPWYQSL